LLSPYNQGDLDNKLEKMLLADKSKWRENAIKFSKHADIYDMPKKAADVIDQVILKKKQEVSTLGESH